MKSRLAAFRLPDDLIRKINALAKHTRRSKTFLVREAIQQYINEYIDYEIALDRLNDKDDIILSSNEMRKLIGK